MSERIDLDERTKALIEKADYMLETFDQAKPFQDELDKTIWSMIQAEREMEKHESAGDKSQTEIDHQNYKYFMNYGVKLKKIISGIHALAIDKNTIYTKQSRKRFTAKNHLSNIEEWTESRK